MAGALLIWPDTTRTDKTIDERVSMKRIALFSALVLLAAVARAAEPKDEVVAAAKKLGEQANYSYKQTSEGGQFRQGPSDGRVDKDGTILVTMSGRDNTMIEAVVKGEKGAMTNQDGEWQSLAEIEAQTEGFGRFRAGMIRNLKAPAKQAEELANDAKELKKDGDAIAGDLTTEGAKKLMSFGGRGAPQFEIKNPSGSVKFWVKDGMLSKYQYHTKGTVNFNGDDRDIDRTITVEVNKVGETKVNIPEAAKKKLS
jgi:hypothetical protein